MRRPHAIFAALIAAALTCAAAPQPHSETVNLVPPPDRTFVAWKARVLARFATRPVAAAFAQQAESAPEASRADAEHAASTPAEKWVPPAPTRHRRGRWWARTARRDAPVASDSDGDLGGIRTHVLEKLKELNARQPVAPAAQPQQAPDAAGAQPTASAAPLPKPPCAKTLDLYAWERQGKFEDVLASLRAAVARSGDAAPDTATLAEFYLVNGLANEAISTTAAASVNAGDRRDRARLARDVDIARLARGEAIASDSPLLTENADCQPRDLGLWRALQAAATGDPQTVAAEAGQARLALESIPSPLREAFAFAITTASENRATLQSMAAALRNRSDGGAEERAVRFLIRARLAADDGEEASERAFLGETIAQGRTFAGLDARVLLAALDAGRSGTIGARARALLRDFARTYRFSRLGEDAALALARSKLARGDYAAALAIADASTANHVGGESRGARMAAQILRELLVRPPGPGLPDLATRIALYWRYEGYATPGERGDDIRLGAIRLMLSEHLPEAALEVAKQISPAVAVRPDAAAPIAMAEAEADNGDPTKALASPAADDPAGRRAAAEALFRLGFPADAARKLDGLPGLADRMRRADLLFLARDWPGAASAYAAALRDPGLGSEPRALASSRFGIAAALSPGPPSNVPPLAAASADPSARRLFALAVMPPAAPPGANPVAAIRAALARTGQIETMLNP